MTKNQFLSLITLACLATAAPASAADERAKLDVNQKPAEIAVTTGTAPQIRQLRATDAGYLIVVTTTPGASGQTVSQGDAAAASGAWPVKVTDGTDTADVTASSALKVDGSAVTQPVSAASLPLPAGAATEATLSTLNGKIPASPAQDRTTAAAPAAARLSDGSAFYKATTPSDTQPVSAASLPLPTGAATETTLSGVKTGTDRIPAAGQAAMAASLPVAIASNQSAIPVTDNAGSLTVDANDLDVRNLASGQDSVAAVQSGAWTITTAEGAVNTPLVSTGTCGSSATLAFGASANKSSLFCNEGTDAIRVGPSSITSAIGLKVLGETCASLDGEVSAYSGALYCIRTTGSDQAFSAYRGQ